MALQRRSRAVIHSMASDLLYRYGFEECAPVAVEEMAEFDRGLSIEPRAGLHADIGVQGAVSYDLTTIYIENSLWTNERLWRNAIAHEVAHIVLHGEFIRSLDGGQVDGLRAAVLGITDADNDVLEYEAEAFVDALLVPESSLRTLHDGVVEELAASGRSISELSESSKQTLAGRMARALEVPTSMVIRMLVFHKLDGWLPEPDTDTRSRPGFRREL